MSEALFDEMIAEYAALVKAGEVHRSHLHETDAAKRDNGGMKFCGGCRRTVLAQRLFSLERVSEDTVVQKTKELPGISRKEAVEQEIAAKLERERGP